MNVSCHWFCSRKRFSEREAEQWWAENRVRVHEQYNVRGGIDRVNNSTVPPAPTGLSSGSRQGEDGRPLPPSSQLPVTYWHPDGSKTFVEIDVPGRREKKTGRGTVLVLSGFKWNIGSIGEVVAHCCPFYEFYCSTLSCLLAWAWDLANHHCHGCRLIGGPKRPLFLIVREPALFMLLRNVPAPGSWHRSCADNHQ